MSNARSPHGNRSTSRLLAALLIATPVLLTIGCASPGPPRPPSLNLPRPVTDLTANRTGDKVILQWTTPAKTTDNLPIKGAITAHICRASITANATPATAAAPTTPKPTGKKPSKKSAPPKSAPAPTACTPILSIPANPGTSTITETLTASLTADPVILLDYRIELTNAAGHSAGSSNAAYALTGSAPLPVQSLHATAIPTGVMLEWNPTNPTPATTVELDRIDTSLTTATPSPKPNQSLQLANKPSPEVHLRTPATTGNQPAGTLDQTARFGDTYRYTAERVRTLQLNGHIVQIHSEPSTPVTLTLHDTFPPATPTGLVGIPNAQQSPSIDLSWEPNAEPDLAGYIVYRRTASGPATRLTATPLSGPAYRDTTATPGQHYVYTVTAIDNSGNESKPTPNLEQTLPQP